MFGDARLQRVAGIATRPSLGVRAVRKALLLTVLLLAWGTADAQIQRIAQICNVGICLYWWPKLPTVPGWHQDKYASYHYGANMLAPNGYTFANAPTVMYAKAMYKPRVPELKSVAMLIDEDEKGSLQDDPHQTVASVGEMVTADGNRLKAYTFFPQGQGNWERVAYGQEGSYYLIFALSARTKAGYEKALAAYQFMVAHYRSNPNRGKHTPKRDNSTTK